MNLSKQTRPAPDVDYLTRDYRGLREQLIELVTRSGTSWTERSAADLGMTALEILAYTLDHLAYAGDRVAAEGFLRTARSRQSARMHAALGDYRLDRGSTSTGYQHFAVIAGALVLPAEFPVGPRLAADQEPEDRDVFETVAPATLDARHNTFTLRKSVGVGSSLLWLGGPQREPLDLWVAGLRPGMCLALVSRDDAEIVRVASVQSGAVLLEHPCRSTFVAGNSDRAGRVLGNLVSVRRGRRGEWQLLGRGGAARDELPDAVYFRRRIAVVRALADRVEQHRDTWHARPELESAWQIAQRNASLVICRLRTVSSEALTDTLAGRLEELLTEAATALRGLLQELGLAVPGELRASKYVTVPRQRITLPPERPPLWLDGEATLEVVTHVGSRRLVWTEVEDFLRSGVNDRHYVVEIANEREVALRFGDGEHGAMPSPGTVIMARWIVGDPSLGDVGRVSLTRALGDHDLRLDPATPTINPLPTAGARPPEPLERVADRLRRRLAVPAIPVTRADFVELLEQRPEVIEAAVLTTEPRLIRVAVRLAHDLSPATAVPSLQRWCETTRLAGTHVQLSLARSLHVSVAAAVRVHPEAEREAVRAGCKVALRTLLGDREGRQLGVPCTRGELLRALEAVNGVEWSELYRFDRAGGQVPMVRDSITPTADQLLRCHDDPEVEATGRIEIRVIREYGLRIELNYTDIDLVPPQDQLQAALFAALTGPACVPVREPWPEISTTTLRQLLAKPPFTSGGYSLRLRALLDGDRSVDHILLAATDVPALRSLQLVPRHVEEIDE